MGRVNNKIKNKSKAFKMSSRGLFILPHFAGLALMYILPFFMSVWLSLQVSSLRFRGFTFANYISVVNNSAFQLALKNNLIFMMMGVPLIVCIGCLISYWLWELESSPWLVVAFVLPICLPSVSVIGFFRGIVHIGSDNLLNTVFAMATLIIIFIWKYVGYNILIFMAGFSQVPLALIESAQLDGASRWQVFRHITVPELLPVASFSVIVSIINSYKVYKEIYLLEGRYPSNSIYMLQNYLNNKAIKFDLAELAAASNFILLVLLILICIVYFLHSAHQNLEKRNTRKNGGG